MGVIEIRSEQEQNMKYPKIRELIEAIKAALIKGSYTSKFPMRKSVLVALAVYRSALQKLLHIMILLMTRQIQKEQ